MATNLEILKKESIDEIVDFLKDHKQYHCLHCFYHYEKGDCYDKDCQEGYKKWLEMESSDKSKK